MWVWVVNLYTGGGCTALAYLVWGWIAGSTGQLGLHLWSFSPAVPFVRTDSEHLRSLLEVHLEGPVWKFLPVPDILVDPGEVLELGKKLVLNPGCVGVRRWFYVRRKSRAVQPVPLWVPPEKQVFQEYQCSSGDEKIMIL